MLRQMTTLTRTMVTMCARAASRSSSIASGRMHVSRENTENGMSTQAQTLNNDRGITEANYSDAKTSTANGQSTLYTDSSSDTLSFNFEDMTTSSLQREVIDELLADMINNNTTAYQFVKFNHVTETVYRYKLHYVMRKLGYRGIYTRYNGETGMARFALNVHEQS